ncbi:methionyl-tRNA formyltransferase [Buchnera aphidicola (Muscaphis stroyani)]|uniref:Methionyl-tRNA formyltransferase n=1 Tax=Buchnera aphidicola (Muscaphis stroyani) TaxID=1241869 RepID=A0A4D6Y5U3_9GAMM|nr:methionyl-tRNA formyltransferase [Buchnera aphidicola]QCI24529.1 methionyl-tRNA formyltransferase [Buchnera aphidicola (Muscaphis stroyani)]
MKKLKIIFAGTAYFSAEHLQSLINSQHCIKAIITQPDRPSGRNKKIIFSAVKMISIKYNIPIIQPLKFNNNTINQISKYKADIMIVVSYGQIIPKEILSIFPMGCINVHASLLPRWRGATPIQSAILNGDKKTGISIISINEKIDAGNILYSKECSICPKDTTHSLSLKLIPIGIQALSETLEKIARNRIIQKIQNEKYATLSKKIFRKNAFLNWNIEAEILERLIRAFNPWPICYFMINKTIIKVWKASVMSKYKKNYSIGEIILADKRGIQVNTINKILNIEQIQISGKKVMSVEKVLISKKKWFKIGVIL